MPGRFIRALDAAQGVGQRPRGVSDHERIARIGLGLTRMQVAQPSHRQPGQIPDIDTMGLGHRNRQGTNVGWLVHDHKNPAMMGQRLQQLPQLLLILRQRRIVKAVTFGIEGDRVMRRLADVQTEEHIKTDGIDRHHNLLISTITDIGRGIDGRHPR